MKNILYIAIFVIVGFIVATFITVFSNKKKASKSISTNFKHFEFSDFDSPAVSGVDSSEAVRTSRSGTFLKDSGFKFMERGFLDSLEGALERFYGENDTDTKVNVLSGYISPQLLSFLIAKDLLKENENFQVTGRAARLDTSELDERELKLLVNALKSKGIRHIGYGENFLFVSNIPEKDRVDYLIK